MIITWVSLRDPFGDLVFDRVEANCFFKKFLLPASVVVVVVFFFFFLWHGVVFLLKERKKNLSIIAVRVSLHYMLYVSLS